MLERRTGRPLPCNQSSGTHRSLMSNHPRAHRWASSLQQSAGSRTRQIGCHLTVRGAPTFSSNSILAEPELRVTVFTLEAERTDHPSRRRSTELLSRCKLLARWRCGLSSSPGLHVTLTATDDTPGISTSSASTTPSSQRTAEGRAPATSNRITPFTLP